MEEAGLIRVAGQTVNYNLQAFRGVLNQAGMNSMGDLVTQLFV